MEPFIHQCFSYEGRLFLPPEGKSYPHSYLLHCGEDYTHCEEVSDGRGIGWKRHRMIIP